MHSLAALLLATPVFGFSLQPPSIQPIVDPVAYGVFAHIGTAALLQDAAQEGTDDASAEAATDEKASAKEADKKAEQDDYNAEVKRRNSLIKIHRPLGMATWAAMTITEVLGFIQYYNKYGFFAGEGDNPCVKGTAVFGQGQCTSPLIHLTAASVTTALYATTFTVSLMMPDPDDLSNGKGEFADTLRMHKLLRWVHFSGMVTQILLGLVIAHASWVGLNRARDYNTLQTLATVHLATGLVTYGALTWAGALMTF
jgi:hypothetical protein